MWKRNKQRPRTLVAYTKKQASILFFFFGCAFVFYLLFILFQLDLEVFFYGMQLCLVLAIPFVVYHYSCYNQKYKKLQGILNGTFFSLDTMPYGTDLIEKQYQQLLERLSQEKEQSVFQNEVEKKEMMDYYALWVHQIKTPIASIDLMLQLEDTEMNRTLQGQLFRVEQYVEMVLCYVRLGSETTDYQIKQCPLENIVKQAVRKFAPLFIEKKIKLVLQPISISVLTDEKWLQFVIEQLLSNALKYTQEGQIAIYMENEYVLVIADTGIGIAPEDIPRLFQKGFTGANGRKNKSASGLGLYLCRRILSKLSHTITVESQVSKGTKIKIDLGSVPFWGE